MATVVCPRTSTQPRPDVNTPHNLTLSYCSPFGPSACSAASTSSLSCQPVTMGGSPCSVDQARAPRAATPSRTTRLHTRKFCSLCLGLKSRHRRSPSRTPPHHNSRPALLSVSSVSLSNVHYSGLCEISVVHRESTLSPRVLASGLVRLVALLACLLFPQRRLCAAAPPGFETRTAVADDYQYVDLVRLAPVSSD
ncbi:hypothetical protein Micbo1qcDRAFT_157776 [Microdochium bolleyi]|uniref:Uncharacterized protein n=1 Tax=Microdochium bolleyi TaxID=196109 RepID=A0A136JEY0_9PEZI|nr:hypothetical protein Micbo1qcDRAFT_157776 [Microdochium bolleyi]